MSLDNVSLPEFLTLEQAARVLGCRPEDIAALIRARRLPQLVRYGRRVIPGWSVLEVLGQMKAEAERLIADGGVGCEPSPAPTHPRASKDEPPGNGATLRPVPKLDDVTVGATAKAGVEDEPSPPAEPGPSPTQPACDGSVTAHVPALCRLEKCGNPLSPNECDGVTAKPKVVLGGGLAPLLDELVVTLDRFLFLPSHAAEASALWIVHTHAFDAADHTPRLDISSPEKRCGKSTLLKLLNALVAHPVLASNITAAATFRVIEQDHPTLLIDEADTFLTNNETLRSVLNSGHSRNLAFVIRCEGEQNETRRFSTWAPVAVAHIGSFPQGFSTLDDRSIRIDMERKPEAVRVTRLTRQWLSAVEQLAPKIARWGKDNLDALKNSDPEIPDSLDDRAADNWRPLLAIADAAGGDWPSRARDIAVALSDSRAEKDSSTGSMLLSDIRDIFQQKNTDRLRSSHLCTALEEMETRPWGEFYRGEPITPTKLAKLLEPFKIEPGSVRFSDKTAKGYKLEWFQSAFERYLAPKTTPASPPA